MHQALFESVAVPKGPASEAIAKSIWASAVLTSPESKYFLWNGSSSSQAMTGVIVHPTVSPEESRGLWRLDLLRDIYGKQQEIAEAVATVIAVAFKIEIEFHTLR